MAGAIRSRYTASKSTREPETSGFLPKGMRTKQRSLGMLQVYTAEGPLPRAVGGADRTLIHFPVGLAFFRGSFTAAVDVQFWIPPGQARARDQTKSRAIQPASGTYWGPT